MSKPNKYNASGMGAQPKLNSAQLYNGPSRPGGQQPARTKEGTDGAIYTKQRETPFNQHGVTGKVEPASTQPSGAVKNT
jgi:hypothetical protein|tara:strand:+ start:44 stop:280 length:237 start_codon:yes stop_codon:yes gene_type:complete